VTAHAGDVSERLVKAIAHPLRHRILVAIQEAGEASPVEVAATLGQPLGRVSHHVRVLAGLGAVELVRTRPRRGAVEHFYRAAVMPWYDDEVWARLPLATRRAVFGSTLERLMQHISAAAERGGFDHVQAHVSYTALDLDDEGMDAVVALLNDTLAQLQVIQRESEERRGERPASLRTEVGLVLFERD
jgi:DNA-binding transcriptional ArsR family regulator